MAEEVQRPALSSEQSVLSRHPPCELDGRYSGSFGTQELHAVAGRQPTRQSYKASTVHQRLIPG